MRFARAARRTERLAGRGRPGSPSGASAARMPQFPRWEVLGAPPSDVTGRAGPGGPPGVASTGRALGGGLRDRVWRPPGRARRKPGREAGGGAAALSHSRLTRPPLPGAEVTAARDGRPPRAAATACRVAASRDRRAAESRSEDRQGRAGRPGRCPGATSGGDPRPEDVPRGRACATPSPRRPLPRPVTHEGRWGTGPSSEPSAPRPGRVL